MAKIILIDDVPHRRRRGKIVPIPQEWLGQVTHPQTIRKRQSKEGQQRHFKRKHSR
jgi:hypothetical protein